LQLQFESLNNRTAKLYAKKAKFGDMYKFSHTVVILEDGRGYK